MSKLLVIGGGRMGQALVGGLLRSGWVEPGELAVAETSERTRHELQHRYPDIVIGTGAVPAVGAVLAVKPIDAEAGAAVAVESGAKRLVSIAAGVDTVQLQQWVGNGVAVLRAMPNLPAVLGAGATAVAGGQTAVEEDLDWAESLLSALGVVARVPEDRLDAVTGLSGSGPAYLFLLAEAMIEAGTAQGIEAEVTRLLVNQTLLGAARLLVESAEPAEALRAAVTSPGGTTAAGLSVLERRELKAAVVEAVAAATEQSRRLGQSGQAGRDERR